MRIPLDGIAEYTDGHEDSAQALVDSFGLACKVFRYRGRSVFFPLVGTGVSTTMCKTNLEHCVLGDGYNNGRWHVLLAQKQTMLQSTMWDVRSARLASSQIVHEVACRHIPTFTASLCVPAMGMEKIPKDGS